jgi:hypothetical protein
MAHKDSYSMAGMARVFVLIKAQFKQTLMKLGTPNIFGLDSKQFAHGS